MTRIALAALLTAALLAACAPTPTPTPAVDADCLPPGERMIVHLPPGMAIMAAPIALSSNIIEQASTPELATLGYVVACLPPAELAAVRGSGMEVEEDGRWTIPPGEDAGAIVQDVAPAAVPWGILKVQAQEAVRAIPSPAGVRIAIIDTGIAGCTGGGALHPEIGPCVGQKDYTGGAAVHPHGSHVSGTAKGQLLPGVYPPASLLDCRALDSNGSGSYSWIASCIVWSADNAADVINMSLGGSTTAQVLTDAIAYARGKGTVIVAAAGNSNTSSPSYPGCSAGVIGVGASDENDARASFSNYNSSAGWSPTACVDLAAPGTNIASSVPGGGYASYSGTSMASPHVAGAVALLRAAHPGIPEAAVLAALRTGDAGPGNLGGVRLNVLKALQSLGDVTTEEPPADKTVEPPDATAPPSPATPMPTVPSGSRPACVGPEITALVRVGVNAWREMSFRAAVVCP